MNLNNLFNNFPIGIVYQNAIGEITEANKAAVEILGLSKEQMQGKKSVDPGWRSVKEDGTDFPGEEHPAMVALRTGNTIRDAIMGVYHPKKDDIIWINIHAVPEFKNGNKKPFQVFTTFTDITQRVKTRRKLIDSEKKYRKLIEDIHLPLLIIQNGKIKYVNNEFINTSGYSIDEVYDNEFIQFVHPEDRDMVYKNYHKRIAGNELMNRYQSRAILKNGKSIWVDVDVSNTSYNDEQAIMVTLNNIDNEVKAVNELQRKEHDLRVIMNTTRDMIYAVDHDYKLINANQKFIDTTIKAGGKPLIMGESIMGKEYPEDFLKMWEGYFNRALRGETFIVETELMWRDGELHYVENTLAPGKDENGNIYCAIVSSNDITQKKKSQILLEESQKKYKALFENSGSAINVLDKEGRFLHVNKLSAANMGGVPSDFVGKSMLEVLDEKTAKEFIGRNKRLIESGEGETYERNYSLPSGEKIFLVTDVILKDTEGIGVALQSSSIDVTELRNLQHHFKNVLDNASEIIFAIDKNYKLILANKAFSTATIRAGGHEIKIGEPIISNNYPSGEIIEKWKANCEKVFNGEFLEFESSIDWDDGPHHFINYLSPLKDSMGTITGVVINSSDITKRNKVFKELQKKEQELESIISRSNAGTWIWSIQSGETIFNEKWANIVGYTLDELSPVSIETWINLVHPDDLMLSNKLLDKHFNGETSYYECDVRMKHKKGYWIWVKDKGSVESYDAEGKPIKMSGIHLDITNFKKAEIAKLESARKLEGFISNLPGIAFRCKNDEHWTMEFMSQETKKITGYDPSELIDNNSKHFSDIIHTEDQASIKKEIESALNKNKPYEIEYRIVRKDGKIIWVSERGSRNNHGSNYEYLEGIIIDVSARKNFERNLIKSETKFRNLFENHGAVKLLINPDDGNIIDANKRASEFYGWTIPELKKMNISDINILSESVISDKINEVNKKEKIHFEFKHRLRNGNVRDVDVYSTKIEHGDNNFLYSIIFDITDKNYMKARLKLLGEAIEQSPVAVFITDSKGIISYVNKTFTTNTGYEESEVIGKDPSLFNSGRQDQTFYENLWSTIKNGKIFSATLYNKKKTGETFPIREIISPIQNHEGVITNFVALQQDLSELILAKERAEESDRLKSAFLATMNHELRTPLNHILGFSDMIPDMTSDENIKEFSKLIYESGTNLLSIIEDVFDLAMIEQSEVVVRREEFYIRDIYINLKNELKDLLNEANKNEAIKLEFNIDSKIVSTKVKADKSKILIVVSNLLRNAIKFTHKGFIRLSFHIVEQNNIQIIVADSGIGISRSQHKIIFDAFRQVEDSHTREYEGIGIGLALSKRIAEVMNGSIEVESEIGVGSIFKFTIPIEIQSEKDILIKQFNDQQETTDNQVFRKNKFLIVEDDNTSMLMIGNFLKVTQCDLLFASNGQECCDLYKQHPDIDLILMDIKMPIMDGFEATSKIRNENPDIPIIAMTAYSLLKDKEKALTAGCNDIITKPINKSLLIKKLKSFLK